MRCILPCAGYGTRMSMATDKSKELLLDPSNNKPIIEYHLDICKQFNLNPLVISRPEKLDLIEYCGLNKIDLMLSSHLGEWPRTVFLSNDYWEEDNILLLPDTRFEPISIISNIKLDLSLGADISLGVHKVSQPYTWCIIKDYKLFEKPQWLHGQHYAFGIIGFKRGAGLKLFDELERHKKTGLLTKTSLQYLDNFKDITRTGKVE